MMANQLYRDLYRNNVTVDELVTDRMYVAGYDSPMKWWDRRNEVWFRQVEKEVLPRIESELPDKVNNWFWLWWKCNARTAFLTYVQKNDTSNSGIKLAFFLFYTVLCNILECRKRSNFSPVWYVLFQWSGEPMVLMWYINWTCVSKILLRIYLNWAACVILLQTS